MEMNELLGLARKYAASVKEKFPDYASLADTSVTLIQTARGEILSGVTGIGFDNGTAVIEDSAQQALHVLSGHQIAVSFVTVKVADGAVAEQAEKSMDMLVSANASNAACLVAVSESEIKPASELTSLTSDVVNDFMSGFDDAESAPAHEKKTGSATNQFVEGLQIDENNPFFDSASAPGEVKTLDAEAQHGQGQYPGFGGQAPGYPQQGGYPMQGGYPQQSFVPQQQMGVVSQSVHAVHAVQQSSMVSQTLGGSNGGAYRKRLNSFLDDTEAAAADAAEELATGLSKEEMLKNAKQRKKVAKNNFNYKKGV